MIYRRIVMLVMLGVIATAWQSCDDKETAKPPQVLQLSSVMVGTTTLNLSDPNANTTLPPDKPVIATFSAALNESTVTTSVQLKKQSGEIIPLEFSYLDENKTFSASPVAGVLTANATYQLVISDQLRGANGEQFPGITVTFTTVTGVLQVTSLKINNTEVLTTTRVVDVPLVSTILEVTFSAPLDPATAIQTFIKVTGAGSVPLSLALSDENRKLTVTLNQALKDLRKYDLQIASGVKGINGETMATYVKPFYTTTDPNPKFPIITDDELLTKVQEQTFKYFWDFGHPASGMARERNTSGNTVTSGGSGFGIMSLIVGIERNFITRAQGVERMTKIVSFLETADRFHGAWSHWIDGNTGKVIPFSTKDNGGDLVETSFLVQGLLTFRQYLNSGDATELALKNRINALWESVEWDWYRKDNQQVLYWHWSPNYNWDMNFALSGYFEEQITYFLAASSPTHGIPKSVYTNGFAKNGAIVKNNTYYGITLPLETPAPLFWVQYSYLGLDPHFTDDYANYWTQNVNATLINQAYCIANPKKFVGYSAECWGLTASDNQDGYNAHSPGNDLGVITPTAALSSFPYTPDESMKALKFFYYKMGDRLWGEYGFVDAFNITEGWTADSYLAIDQGPIIVMIENHRTGLLWDLFMSAPEVQAGVTKLNFTY